MSKESNKLFEIKFSEPWLQDRLYEVIKAELDKPEYEDMFVERIGQGIYKIGRYTYTGEEGLKQFNKAMKEIHESDNHTE